MEPAIIINGYRLTQAQSMAVRVAVSDLYAEACQDPYALGKDELGISITAAYKARSHEVLEIMARTTPEQPKPIPRRRKTSKTITVATHA
jgi:uncharacterized lipoprotein YajG